MRGMALGNKGSRRFKVDRARHEFNRRCFFLPASANRRILRAIMPTLPLAFDPGGAFDPFLLLITALVLDAYLGEMRLLFKVIPHPIAAIGGVIGWFDRRLNRPERGEGNRRVRGILVVVFMTARLWASAP